LKKYADYQEFSDCRQVERRATVTIEDLRQQYQKMAEAAKKIDELEAEEERKKQEALKTIVIEGKKIHFNALDGRTYDIEIHSEWIPKTENFTSYVYRHRYRWTAELQQEAKNESFFRELLEDLLFNTNDFSVSVNNKPSVRVTRKTVGSKKGEVTLMYLNGKKVAREEIEKILYAYFIQGQALKDPSEKKKEEKTTEEIFDTKKQREEKLKTQGITGYLEDLEGEIPVTLMFERDGNNWYLVLGSKRVHVKGGYETIKSLENVLTGNAQLYQERHSTIAFFRRLSEAVGEQEASEMVKEVKNMGQLLKVLKAKEGDAQ
jgi:hypothetical protein